jgi:hypothetical protein
MQPSASGPPTYTFTSLNAGVIPRVLYWEVSFPAASVPRCEAHSSQPNETYQTQPRMLTVFAPPVPNTFARAGAATREGQHQRAHPAARIIGGAFGVRCSEGCTGDTYYRAFILRAHHGPLRAPQLDLPPQPVSIPEWGGEQHVTRHYEGRTLRQLKSILRGGGEIELRMQVKVEDLAGHTVRAQATTRLHG